MAGKLCKKDRHTVGLPHAQHQSNDQPKDDKNKPRVGGEMSKAAPGRVARHRNKGQDLRYTDKCRPGKAMPCDYAFSHGVPIGDLNEEEKERLRMDIGEDIQVMRVCIADLPLALSLEVMKERAERNRVHQKLKEAVKTGRKPKDRDKVPYMAV